MFKRIVTTACFAGVLAALLLTLMQTVSVSPLILQAEVYEKASEQLAEQAPHEHAAGEHAHDAEAWSPEDGWQRKLSTFGGDLVVAIGYALMLAALYNLRAPAKAWHGILWGLAGYATFSLAPAVGLPPELPGTESADLLLRQHWWEATALATAVGLALIVFGKHWLLSALAVLLIALPHIIGAPQPAEHHSLAPEELQAQFRVASLLINGVFWVALGGLTGWFFSRRQDESVGVPALSH